MKNGVKTVLRAWAAMAAAAAMAGLPLAAGCEGKNHDIDHTPPKGMGSLAVDNPTLDDIKVYVDDAQVGRAKDDSAPVFDLKPGVHRVVLDQEDGDRHYASDIDILNGRVTILRVSVDLGDDDYRVGVDID